MLKATLNFSTIWTLEFVLNVEDLWYLMLPPVVLNDHVVSGHTLSVGFHSFRFEWVNFRTWRDAPK